MTTNDNSRQPDANGLIPFRDDGARAYAILTVEACRERIEWLEQQQREGRTDLGPSLEDAHQNLEEALAREAIERRRDARAG